MPGGEPQDSAATSAPASAVSPSSTSCTSAIGAAGDTAATWTAHVSRGKERIAAIPTDLNLPNHFVLCLEFVGNDIWIGTGHGLARGSGKGYYGGLHPTADVTDKVALKISPHR